VLDSAIMKVTLKGRMPGEGDMTTITQPMESEVAATAVGHRWGWLLALGVVEIIAGSLAIATPVVASLAAVAVFGAVLIVTAIFQMIHAFKTRAWPRSALYGLGGVLYAIAGLLVVIFPIGGALALAVMIAILLIADGALRLGFGMTVRPIAGWGWIVAGWCRQHSRRRHSIDRLARDRPVGYWSAARRQPDLYGCHIHRTRPRLEGQLSPRSRARGGPCRKHVSHPAARRKKPSSERGQDSHEILEFRQLTSVNAFREKQP